MIRYQTALQSQNLKAFLHVIRVGEGTADEDGYRRHYGGTHFESFADHPKKVIKAGKWTSSAAGAYQFLTKTWAECKAALNLPDFSPASHDLAAVFLIDRRRALNDVLAGRIKRAIELCAKEWASLPGSPYGQPTKTMAQALAAYEQAGGVYTEVPVTPFIAAAIPALVQAAPALIRIFGDSPTSEKNAKAAELVADLAVAATGAQNTQEAVEQIQSDPEASKAFQQAVQDEWYSLQEVGGGVQAAREANKSQPPPARNLALWVTALLLPLVYMTVAAVLFGGGWSSDVKAMVVAAVVTGALGGITAYWLGTSASSSKKTDLLASK